MPEAALLGVEGAEDGDGGKQGAGDGGGGQQGGQH